MTKLPKKQDNSRRTARQLGQGGLHGREDQRVVHCQRMHDNDSVLVEQEVARIHAGVLLSSRVEMRDGHLLRISVYDADDGRWVEEASLEGRGDYLRRLDA